MNARNRSRHAESRAAGPIRIFYAFDPLRTVILLIGGHKREQDRFCQHYVWRADAIYDRYLQQLRREGPLEPERGRER